MSELPKYQSPLGTRYASPAMQQIWSASRRAGVWRRLWLALAEEQQLLGIDIPDEALAQMRQHLDDADLAEVRTYEQRLRHDVMAHIHHFGDQVPAARPFLHLGATSCFVTDNADLIIQREALRLTLGRLATVIRTLSGFAMTHRALPTLAYTHFQPAQLTTVGKRASLWLQDLVMDADAIRNLVDTLPFRGCKGTTGTQASYLELFDGDHAKVTHLDQRMAKAFEFPHAVAVSGQTYTRKIDGRIAGCLAGVAESASKFGNDVRLLQHERELLEPFERDQVGSTAMAYKRNPMRAERICALARYVISLQQNAHYTAATQWLERTLDDSANRRLSIPDAFLGVDAILMLVANVVAGLEVRKPVIAANVEREMPFMATERWLMLGVGAGGNRQALHEVIRKRSHEVAERVARGEPNDLVEQLASSEAFAELDTEALRAELDPKHYIGRASEQVGEFVDGPVASVLASLEPFSTSDKAVVSI